MPRSAKPVYALLEVGVSPINHSLAVGLGANLGDPLDNLIRARPDLENLLKSWWGCGGAGTRGAIRMRWSPLFRTEPLGGPEGQPDFLNAVVLVNGQSDPPADPIDLLDALLALEARFGRLRQQRWGPRSLDLDLLWCGSWRITSPRLCLPHPLLLKRSFVLAPLAAIDASFSPPAGGRTPFLSCSERLHQLNKEQRQHPPLRLPPCDGWPE